jgi:hypothetical protein
VRHDSEDRFCINCQHYVPIMAGDTDISHMCNARTDPVTGEPFLTECSKMRQPGMWCGGVGFLYVGKKRSCSDERA